MEAISAGDLEKFCYCPMSWWISRQQEVSSATLQEGERRHEELGNDLHRIVAQEQKALIWEKVVLWTSVMATTLALVGVFLILDLEPTDQSRILGIISIVWIILAVFMLYRSASLRDRKRTAEYEQYIAILALLGMLTSLNSVPLFGLDESVAVSYELVAIILLVGASIALNMSFNAGISAQKGKERAEVEGEIKYVGEGKDQSGVLSSERYGLRGRPDYIIEVEGHKVPVEVKTGRTPRGPLFSHILQVAAYCLLIEESGEPVSHGILKYDQMEHEIEFDSSLRELLLQKLDEMRGAIKTGEVHRNHHRVGKCRTCSRRHLCPERLD